MAKTTDEEADRLIALLDLGLAKLRNGDAETAVLALKEALESADRLPKKRDDNAL